MLPFSAHIHSQTMKGLFNPVCNRIGMLIQEQRNKLHEEGKVSLTLGPSNSVYQEKEKKGKEKKT